MSYKLANIPVKSEHIKYLTQLNVKLSSLCTNCWPFVNSFTFNF